MDKFKKYLKRFFIFIFVTVLLLVAGAYAIMWICVNGPSWVAGDLFVLSVRETSAAGFLANIYCTDEEIQEIEKRNKVEVTNEITDTSIIQIKVSTETGKDKEENKENAGAAENAESGTTVNKNTVVVDENGIRVERITGSTYKGVMMIIDDPSRVVVASLDTFGEDITGKTVTQFIEQYNGVAGANAGGFEDIGGNGLGGIPEGIVISGGELKWGEPDKSYEIIGFTKENVLVVGWMTAERALDMGIRDAVSFGPILIVNGEPAITGGTGGGLNPRTAIGQRKDGAVLLLVVDGRQPQSLGASMNDLINVMLEYGAVNAANLDGGSSSGLYYKGQILNINSSLIGMRYIPDAIVVK